MLFHINSRKEELKLWDRDPERDVREKGKRKRASERERKRKRKRKRERERDMGPWPYPLSYKPAVSGSRTALGWTAPYLA